MPEEINQEIQALRELISILETSQRQLEAAGESTASLTALITDLQSAVEGAVAVIPKLNQITDAIDAITSGTGGRQQFGEDIGLRRLDLITKGYQQAIEEQETLKRESLELEFPEFRREIDAPSSFGSKAIEVEQLTESLKEFGATENQVNKIMQSLENMRRIDFTKLTLQFKDLDLPDEEISRLERAFLQLRRNAGAIKSLTDQLEDAQVHPESINEIIRDFANMETTISKVHVSMGKARESTTDLTATFTTSSGLTDRYSTTLDNVERRIVSIGDAVKEAKPEVARFAEALQTQGLEQPTVELLVDETFGEGATGFTKLRVTELDEGLTRYNTTIKYGTDVTQQFSRVVDEAGNVFERVSDVFEENPLQAFIEDLESFEVPQKAIDTIVGETFGEGKELSGPRLQELDSDFIKLTGTIQAAGGTTKAYVAYIDDMGNVIKKLPVKEATVSIKDFNDQLSGRVGAISGVNKMLERYKFELSDLKKMTTEASTGITRLDFAMKSQGGATEKLTLHVTQFGKVLTDTQRRFRTFAGGIARNVGESFKWAVAITAVYGPLRKLQDLVQISIDNESKLADIGIVLGKTTSEIQEIFEDAATAAQATGESLNGVIEGYSLAYRATGNIASQSERAATAQQLLIDSLVLSKLSSLEQAEAMDTLVAGLLQVGYNLDQGAELLNKWVAVGKAANVTVDTLATSFAIMATAGEGVGLSFDEINAIVAVVAANTELSAKQAGNAVRAFVSGFQTKNAVEELSKYGIAVQDLEGNSRDFMTVMLDIKQLMDAGLIDDAELNRLGTALGGRGARRGAQFTTFLKSLDEVQGLVTVSAEAQGDAYDALAIKMETVQTAITNLATSFQVLANAVGTDGGVLDLLKGLLGVLDDITKAATSFVGIMGKAAPFLAVAGGLYAYGRSTRRVQQLPGQFGGGVERLLGATGFGQRPGFQQRGALGISGVGQQASATGNTMAQSWGRQAKILAPAIGTLLAQGTLAAFNIAEKDWDGLGAQIGGGIFGFLVSGGNPIGAIIGSTIAEAVVNGLQAAGQSGELADVFKGVFREADVEEPPDTDLTREERLLEEQKQLDKQLRDTVGGEWILGVNLFAKEADNFLRGLVGMPKLWRDELTGTQLAGGILGEAVAAFDVGGAEGVKQFAGRAGLAGFGNFASDEQIEQAIEGYRELLAQIEQVTTDLDSLGKGVEPTGTPLDVELTANLARYGDLLKDEIVRAQGEFNDELIAGDITIKEYRESLERMGTEGESVIQVFTALDDVIGNSADNLILTLDVISRTSSEEIRIITDLTSGIGDLKEQIAELEKEGDLELKLVKEGELEAALFELEQVFNAIRTQQREPLIQFDAPVDLDTRSLEDHRLVVQEAMRILEEDMQESIRLGLIPDDTTIQEVLATHEAIAVAIAGKYVETMQIPLDVYRQAQENLAIPGQIAPPVSPDRGISVRTIEQSQGAFMAAYERQLEFLKQAFGDLYQGDFSTVGLIFEDGVDVLHLDNLAMQLAMQDLIDVNQKQLEGVYNLPTDSSFYVPFQGYRLGFGEGGGAGGGGLDGAATSLEEAAVELKDSSRTLDETFKERLQAVYQRRADAEEETPLVRGGALIGGEKYLEEYDTIGSHIARIAGEKYLEEYADRGRVTLEEPVPIGGEKYLEEYANKEITAIDKFEQSVTTFNQAVSNFIKETFGVRPPDETAIPAIEDPIPQGYRLRGPRTTPILPGAGAADDITSESQDVSKSLIESLFDFNSAIEALRNLFSPTGQGTGPVLPGITGAGLAIPEAVFNKLDSASGSLENVAALLQPTLQPLGGVTPFGGTSDLATDFGGMLDLLNQKISNLSGFTTNLKISSTSTTNLIVDGRTLAQVIKPYLYSDMIRFEDSASSVTKSIVV
jgi:TP901 family phage tail tape measure protein